MASVNPKPSPARGSPAARAEDNAGSSGLLAEASSLWRALHGVAHDYLLLITLETKRAGLSLAFIVAAGVGIALLLITAWLGLMAAAVLGLAGLGLAPGFGILLAVAANLAGAFVLYRVIVNKREDLTFPATVRSLRPPASGSGDAPPRGGTH